MKKHLFIITSVLALCAVSCNPELKEADEPDAVIEATAPAIAIDQESIAAKGFTATITPAEAKGFYAYAVIKGEAAAVSASKILDNSISGALYADYADAAEKASLTVTAEGLTTNAYYTIYAVAANEQGTLSNVVTETVRLGKAEPTIAAASCGFDEESGLVYADVTFSDPIELTGEGKVYAHFYAPYGQNLGEQMEGYAAYNYMNEEYSIEIPADYYYTDGKELVIFLPEEEYVAGAVVTFTWDAGLLVSDKGLNNVAYTRSVLLAYNKVYNMIYSGIGYECETEPWELSMAAYEGGAFVPYADSTIYANDWTKFGEYVSFGDVKLADYDDPSVTLTYKYAGGAKTTSITADITTIYSECAGITLPEDPLFGTYVDISIPKDVFYDKWGNTNAAYEYEDLVLMSYGYELEDFLGTYACEAVSYFNGEEIKDTIVIAASDYVWDPDGEEYDEDPEFDIMITGNTWMGNYFNMPLYGWIDGDLGTITVPAAYCFYAATASYYYMYQTFDYMTEDGAIVLDHPTTTTYTNDGMISVYAYVFDTSFAPDSEQTGYYEVGVDFTATKIADAAPAAARVVAPKNLPKGDHSTELVRVK